MITVRIASEADQVVWSNYVERFPEINHSFSWHWRNIISHCFSHQPYYLIAVESEIAHSSHVTNNSQLRVVGVLPLFFVNSILFGRSLISMPYLNSGGILADNDSAFAALHQKSVSISTELDCKYLELRCREEIPLLQNKADVRSHKVAMLLKLKTDSDSMFSFFSAKLRSQIKRPTKSGIEVRELAAAKLLLDKNSLKDFYTVFSQNMRDLGTPVYPYDLFYQVKHEFGEGAKVFCAYQGKQPLAAGITIRNSKNVEILWASSLRKYNNLSANMLLYWEAIKNAIESNCDVFDFGRSSPESGTFRFKKQWGAEPLPLYWYYHINKGEIPNVNPNNPKFSLLVNTWKCLPLSIANSLGPKITRGLP